MQRLAILVKKVNETRSNFWQVDVAPVCECQFHPEEGRLLTEEEMSYFPGHSGHDDREFAGVIIVTEWTKEGRRIKKKNPKSILVLDFDIAAVEATKLWTYQFNRGFDVDKFFPATQERSEQRY